MTFGEGLLVGLLFTMVSFGLLATFMTHTVEPLGMAVIGMVTISAIYAVIRYDS